MAVLVGSGEMHGGCFFIVPKPSLGAAAARASQSISSLPHNHILFYEPVLFTRCLFLSAAGAGCRSSLVPSPSVWSRACGCGPTALSSSATWSTGEERKPGSALNLHADQRHTGNNCFP